MAKTEQKSNVFEEEKKNIEHAAGMVVDAAKETISKIRRSNTIKVATKADIDALQEKLDSLSEKLDQVQSTK